MSLVADHFDHAPGTRLVFGPGSLERVGELAAGWSARRALVVTDPGIVAAGHAERCRKALEQSGIAVTVYDRVRENPDTDDVAACLQVAREAKVDTLIGLGGGSSLDTAKGCNFILTNGGKMADYWGKGKATRPMLPLIAIPTTAGTGSECQSFALIADAQTHQKMACGDPKAAARVAILDPQLTLTQPRQVTANTGIDTLAHAVEAAVTQARNELSLLYARRSFALTARHLPRVLEAPGDLEARGQMQLAAAWGGTAIECSMLGAAHSAANPLTARHDVIHGQAVGLMLPAVVRYNAADPQVRVIYRQLAVDAHLVSFEANDSEAVESLIACIEKLLDLAGMPRSLSDVNVPRSSIAAMAPEAAGQWTARFNPRPIAEADFTRLYESVCEAPAART